MTVSSTGKSIYFSIFLGDYNYLLKNKNEAFDCFRKIKANVGNYSK